MIALTFVQIHPINRFFFRHFHRRHFLSATRPAMSAEKLTVSNHDEKGRFMRKPSSFRNTISSEPGSEFPPVAGRYRLYVSLACPWAHRCLITRALKGLEHILPITVVHPIMGSAGWSFISPDDGPIESCQPEPEYGFSHVSQLYLKADPHYDARFTVPILWDTERATIVNNESSEIIVMLNDKFNQFAKNPALDLFPEHQKQAITEVSDSFYDSINNGVYRCGFAKTQEAYDEAVIQLFDRLDILENHLSTSRYLVGSNITLADIRLFVTLIRFDPVYVSHFKTDRKRIMDYPNLSGFTADLYQMPSIRKTISFYHIKNHYFRSHPSINLLGIVPIGPDLSYLDQPHGRDKI